MRADRDPGPELTVSILMPVRNAAPFLRECLDSLAAQTFTDWEAVVVDDGSTDDSPRILREYAEWLPMRIVTSSTRQGAAASLNIGIPECRGEFIVRMDADDICVPDRIERQVAFLRANPSVDVCSSGAQHFGMGPEEYHAPPPHPGVDFLRGWTLAHPTMVFRRAPLVESGLRYDPARAYAEDFDLCTRMVGVLEIATINEPLVRYRRHPMQTSTATWVQQEREAIGIQARYVAACLRSGAVPRRAGLLGVLQVCRRAARYANRRVRVGMRQRR